MTTTRREELAWAAGVFDGEGWVGTCKSYALIVPRLAVEQKDRRLLDRFKTIVGCGRIHFDKGRPTKRSPMYSFQASSMNRVQAIIAALWEFLGPVKREQARKALEVAKASYRAGPGSPRLRPHCKRGHEYNAKNTLTYRAEGHTRRVCRKCVRARLVEKTARFMLSA